MAGYNLPSVMQQVFSCQTKPRGHYIEKRRWRQYRSPAELFRVHNPSVTFAQAQHCILVVTWLLDTLPFKQVTRQVKPTSN